MKGLSKVECKELYDILDCVKFGIIVSDVEFRKFKMYFMKALISARV